VDRLRETGAPLADFTAHRLCTACASPVENRPRSCGRPVDKSPAAAFFPV